MKTRARAGMYLRLGSAAYKVKRPVIQGASTRLEMAVAQVVGHQVQWLRADARPVQHRAQQGVGVIRHQRRRDSSTQAHSRSASWD